MESLFKFLHLEVFGTYITIGKFGMKDNRLMFAPIVLGFSGFGREYCLTLLFFTF